MNSAAKQDVPLALPKAVAAALAVSLVACGQGPPADMVGANLDQAVVEAGRGPEPAPIIIEGRIDSDTIGDEAAAGSKSANDKALGTKVRSVLSAERGLKDVAVDVNASSGAVTLYGTAVTPAHRDKAARVALNVDGVKSVTNHLIILQGS